MLTVQHVRIDASLVPVEAPMPPALVSLRADLASGVYDYLSSAALDVLCRDITRATLLATAQFNEHLNSLLAQYGLHVTLVADSADQSAVKYGLDYGMSDALPEALAMRDWFLPAARHTWADAVDSFPLPR